MFKELFILIFIFYLTDGIAIYPVVEKPFQSQECQKGMSLLRITKSDNRGRECCDYGNETSCISRCDSINISDYKYIYKKSLQKICEDIALQTAVAFLRNCHRDAGEEAKRYEYSEPVECQSCNSSDTEFESPTFDIEDDNVIDSFRTLNMEDKPDYGNYN
ncbi:gpb5 family protein [Megaselia abdita]